MDWEERAEREERRYAEGLERMPDAPDARQKQLVRAAAAATGAGLARLMQGRRGEASGWFARSAERFRESFEDAPPGSWGRPIGALKARLLAGDRARAEADARWTLDQAPADVASPIGRYAAALAQLVVGADAEAAALAESLQGEEDAFPRPVADTLAALAAGDGGAYADSLARVLRSFEERDSFLEDIPVADTVIVLEALAEQRGLAVRPSSGLLPVA